MEYEIVFEIALKKVLRAVAPENPERFGVPAKTVRAGATLSGEVHPWNRLRYYNLNAGCMSTILNNTDEVFLTEFLSRKEKERRPMGRPGFKRVLRFFLYSEIRVFAAGVLTRMPGRGFTLRANAMPPPR